MSADDRCPDDPRHDPHAIVLRSLAVILRSPRLSDQAARIEAERLVSATLIRDAESEVRTRHGLEAAVDAFDRLREELALLPGGLAIDCVAPPRSGRAVPTRIAGQARDCVRIALLAIIDTQEAERVRVQWDCDGSHLIVDIRDDGRGDASREDDRHRPIAERVEALAGSWTLDAVPDWGSHLRLLLPLEAPVEEPLGAPERLSPRQRQVHGLVVEGCTNAEIAERLAISPDTAKHHVSALMRSLGVRRRTQIAAIAAELAAPSGP